MYEPPTAPDRRPPGLSTGTALGVGAGLLLAAVWAFGASDVALALTGVFACLVVAVLVGLPGWRVFGLAMLVASAVAFGVSFLLLRR